MLQQQQNPIKRHIKHQYNIWEHTSNKLQNFGCPPKTVNFLGRDILQKMGIHQSQTKTGEKAMSLITTNNKKTHKIFTKFPHLCTRMRRSKNHLAKSTFKQCFKPTQHKRRRVPLHSIDKVEKELKKLIEDKQIIKLEKCLDEYFISPVAITVKRDNSFN